ncbi:MAG: hypothetical protein ACFFC7_33825 [Candidatus Hermodarchaeota archaeon]
MQTTGEKNAKIVLAYCRICGATHRVPIRSDSLTRSTSEGLSKHTFVHEDPVIGSPHALVLILDQNRVVQGVEVADVCIESSPCANDFTVSAYCQICQKYLRIPIGNQKFKEAINMSNSYSQSFIHAQPPHALLFLVDEAKTVIQAELTSFDIGRTIRPKEKAYTILEYHKLPDFPSVFDGLLVFDRRSKIAMSFFYIEEPAVSEIATYMEEDINKLEISLKIYLVSMKGTEYVYILSEGKEICLVGINFNKSYYSWLQILAKILASETKTPSTLGLEIIIRFMTKTREIPQESALLGILFSDFFSKEFKVKDTKIIDRVLQRLSDQFPNTVDIFRPCALGEKTILEVMNSEKGFQHFNEFISLVSFVERRNLF